MQDEDDLTDFRTEPLAKHKVTIHQHSHAPAPIIVNNDCMSCQNSGHDTQLTLRLFKIACLTYKMSDVVYRDQSMSRAALINLRRDLIEKVTTNLSACSLFKQGLIYPRRYFDDLLVEQRQTELRT